MSCALLVNEKPQTSNISNEIRLSIDIAKSLSVLHNPYASAGNVRHQDNIAHKRQCCAISQLNL
jgi:hypothetical protein